MARGDITILREGAFGNQGSRKQYVTSGTTASIKAGELVRKALGSEYVVAWGASDALKPVAGTDYLAGLAASDSTETASAAGIVYITPITPGTVYLAVPQDPTAFDTQAKYDALVGDRVLLDSSASSVQTVLKTDGGTYGLVIEPLAIKLYPGKVAFSLRNGLSYLA